MIYVSGRYLSQNLTGVNRFAYELCRAWLRMDIPFTLCCPPEPIKACYDVSRFHIVVCGWGKSHVWEQIALPFWFSRIKGEKLLVCFTGLGPLLIGKKVMTIHDLAFMANPQWYSRPYRMWYRLMTPLCAKTSLRILTVSNFSKSEIKQRLSVPEEKITIVYNAVAALFRTSYTEGDVHHTQAENEKYILAVSSIDPRKNFRILLKAFSLVKDKDIKLYIVGGQDSIYSASVAELCEVNASKRINWLGRVSDESLKNYYTHALCFVYPSLYEGFGIPPLEAMACGVPTIVSAIPALKEVCQNASLYVNPYDEKDIAAKIDQLASDSGLRQELIQRGHERCLVFDWVLEAGKLADELKNLGDFGCGHCNTAN